jgi:sugar-specific transcriptional regulator TrmB
MHVVNGKEREIVDMLNDFGLSMYEAKMYFTLLAIGEAKVCVASRKASVPQSKAYDVLENLTEKGFVEMSSDERPKKYKAKLLDEMIEAALRTRQKEIVELQHHHRKLCQLLEGIIPVHQKFGMLRLFSPSYQRNHIKRGDGIGKGTSN